MSVRSNRSLPLTLRRSIFVWLLFAAGIGSAISAPQLITQAGTAKTGQSGFDIKSKATAVMLNRQAMAKLKVSDELEISLPNATRYTVVFDRTENHGGEMRSSVGYLKDFGKDFRVILTSGSGGTFGSIRTPEPNAETKRTAARWSGVTAK